MINRSSSRLLSSHVAPAILFRAGKRKSRGGGFPFRMLLILLLGFVWWRSRRRAEALPMEEENREITISGLRQPARRMQEAPPDIVVGPTTAAAGETPVATEQTPVAEAAPPTPAEEQKLAAATPSFVEAPPTKAAPEAPATDETPAAADDLTVIEGIGPKINSVLQEAGIHTYQRLAEAQPDRISEILLASGLRLAKPDTWPEQARLAAAGDWDGLKDLKSRLKGGRQAE